MIFILGHNEGPVIDYGEGGLQIGEITGLKHFVTPRHGKTCAHSLKGLNILCPSSMAKM